jgi:hypothetical protein
MALNCDAASGLLVLLSRREVKSGKGTVPGGTPRPGGNAESDASSEARERDSSSEGWFYCETRVCAMPFTFQRFGKATKL